MRATEYVILVDEQDQELGSTEKLQAHREGLLHRAFSVLIFRQEAQLEVLLQQRAASKYHSPNLWTNACCSHPRPGEAILEAATRRLEEELGLSLALRQVGQFQYRAEFSNGLTENELDHVLVGQYQNEPITPNPKEVQAYQWLAVPDLRQDLEQQPEKYTPWLKKALALACA